MKTTKFAEAAEDVIASAINNATETIWVEHAQEPTFANFLSLSVFSMWDSIVSNGREVCFTEKQVARLERMVRERATALFLTMKMNGYVTA